MGCNGRLCSFSVTRHDHEDIVYKVDLLDLMPSFQFPKRKLMGVINSSFRVVT